MPVLVYKTVEIELEKLLDTFFFVVLAQEDEKIQKTTTEKDTYV